MTNLTEARRFLDLMAEGEPVTFQTFDDSKRKRQELATVLHGDLQECASELQRLNAAGAGVFWMVNYGNGKGRSTEHVTGVRAVFLDLDGAPLQPVLAAGVDPHAVVESSPGKWHVYWLVEGCSLADFTPVQLALASRFNGDPSVKDLPRVLRVPGFEHRKGAPFTCRVASMEPMQPYRLADLAQRLGLRLGVPSNDDGERRQRHEVGTVAEGGRHQHLVRWAAQMNWRGLPFEAIRVAVREENKRCAPPLPLDEVDQIAADVWQRYAGQHGRDLEQGTTEGPLPDHQPRERRRLRLMTAADLRAMPPQRWLIHATMPAIGTAAVFGPSGAGKGFLIIDMTAAVAEGARWFGKRTTKARVVYVALEGQAGVPKRIRAWEAEHGRDFPDSVRFVFDRVHLTTPDDVLDLAAEIEDAGGADVVIIDTVNRASPGADENNPRDAGLIIEGASRLQELIGGLVLLVHHTGKDATKGMRGHSSLHAAMDAAIEVTRTGDARAWSDHKEKDERDGDQHPFGLKRIDLGPDEFGDPTTSCVISSLHPDDGAANARPKLPKGGNQKIVFDALGPLFKESTRRGEGGAPAHRPCLPLDVAVDGVKDRLPVEPKRRRERAQQAFTGLVASGVLRSNEGWLWLA